MSDRVKFHDLGQTYLTGILVDTDKCGYETYEEVEEYLFEQLIYKHKRTITHPSHYGYSK